MLIPMRGTPISKVVTGTTGAALVVVGVAGVFLPVLPGIVLILAGLGLLGREFAWAGRMVERARRSLNAGERPRRGRSLRVSESDQDGG